MSTPKTQPLSEREHDLIVVLRALCDATVAQCEANDGKESILVRMKRNAARKVLARHEPPTP